MGRMRGHVGLLVAVMIVAGAALGVVGQSGAFVALLEYEPITLDPSIAYDVAAWNLFTQVYEGLVKPLPGTTTPGPGLALSWESSENATKWVFHLRQGVVFHDGAAFDASAVKFSFDRLRNINQGPAWMFAAISAVNVIDTYTVEIVLDHPYAPFLAALSQPMGAMIVSPGVMAHEKNGDLAQEWLYDHAAGTGPYKLDRWIHGQEFVLARFDGYRGGWEGDHFDTVIYRLVPEHASQRLLLEQGIAHASNTRDGLPLEALTQLGQAGNLNIYATAGENVDMIGINTAKGPCADPKVRQAISYAMDYAGVADNLYFGRATVAKGPVPPTFWGFDASANPYNYSLATARQLLAAAGHSSGLVLNAITDENALRQREMQTLASALDEIGVKVNIVTMTWPTEYAALTNQDTAPDLYSFTWYADYADPDDVIYPLFHSSQVGEGGFNLGWYSNPAVDNLLKEAQQETNRERRVGLYSQIQRILVEDAAAIWIVNPDAVFAVSSKVEGFVYTPFWSYNIYDMHLKR